MRTKYILHIGMIAFTYDSVKSHVIEIGVVPLISRVLEPVSEKKYLHIGARLIEPMKRFLYRRVR